MLARRASPYETLMVKSRGPASHAHAIHGYMNATFLLVAEPGSTGFRLRKEGEKWEEEFASIPQAVSYARSLPDSKGKIIVMNSMGREVAEMNVEPF